MRKRSETKPKRGFPLAAPPPPPRLEGLSGARLEGEGERLGGQLQRSLRRGPVRVTSQQRLGDHRALAIPMLDLASR